MAARPAIVVCPVPVFAVPVPTTPCDTEKVIVAPATGMPLVSVSRAHNAAPSEPSAGNDWSATLAPLKPVPSRMMPVGGSAVEQLAVPTVPISEIVYGAV